MTIAYSLMPELRKNLKKPLGTLIRGSFAETTKRLKDIIEREKVTHVISVGDTVTKNLVKNNVIPVLAIVDNMTMRKNTKPFSFATERIVNIKNPAATITAEAISTIHEALKANTHTKIVVDGEEDLLTLIAIIHAPENTLVVYGQPYEGIVVVKTTATKKAEIAAILKAMENVRKTK